MKSFEKNYKRIFTIVFLLSGIAFTMFISFMINIETTHAKKKLERKEANNLLEERKNILNEFLKENFDIIISLSRNDFYFNYIENNKYTDFQMFLRAIHGYNKYITNIVYAKADGQEQIKLKRYSFNSSFILNHENDLRNIKNDEDFKNIMKMENGDLYFSKIKTSYPKNDIEIPQYTITVGYKLYDDYSVSGLFLLNLHINDILNDLLNTSNFHGYILDENRCVVATNNSNIQIKENVCIKKRESIINKIPIFNSQSQKLYLAFEGKPKEETIFQELNNTIILVFIVVIIVSLLLGSYIADIPKKLNEKIFEQKKMFIQQSKFAAMGEMIAVISHQWRQPLNEISVLVDEVKFKYDYQVLSKEEIEYLTKEINSSLDYMSNTIDDFNNFFKPNKNKEEFKIYDIFQESLHLLNSRIDSLKVDITYLNLNKEIKYFGYKNEFKQAIINIINNAIDVLEEKEIENKKIILSIEKKSNDVIVSIQDNAGGIPIEIIDDIFNPYFSTKIERNGTGLGLYITKIIIENNMNGEIHVSNINKNARFTIKLPIEEDL